MKVAYVTMQFPAPPETFASNEVRALTSLGVDIEVHSLKSRHPHHARLCSERGLDAVPTTHNSVLATLLGILIAFLHPLATFDTCRWLWRSCKSRPRDLLVSLALLPRALQLVASLRHEPPQLVHLYWGHYPSLVGYLVRMLLPGTQLSMALNAYDLASEYPCSVEVGRSADFLRTHARVNVPHVSAFVGVPPERINVIYNGVDLSMIPQGLDKIKGRIAVASRLIESKGIDRLLKIVARLKAQGQDVSLLVMGEGPARTSLEQLSRELDIEGDVTFLGHVEHSAVLEELARAQITLLLSHKVGERLPNGIKEAMACATVPVVSQTPGIDELVEDGRTGYIVPADDLELAAARISRLLNDEAWREQLASQGRSHIVENFDLQVSARSYLEGWQAALSQEPYSPPATSPRPTAPASAR